MVTSVWDEIPDEDQGWMADWYRTIDEVEAAQAARHTVYFPPPAADEAVAVGADRQTYADRLRSKLLTSSMLDQIEPPTPLIDRVLYLDSLAWIIGRPGCGKTFVALDWAGHVSNGLPWCGFPTTPGPVIYMSPEAPGGVARRVRAWEQAQRQRMSEENFRFLPVAVQAGVDGEWSAFMEVAAEIHPRLIILDTQARVTVGMDENSASDMGVFINKVERLRAATRACVLIVHHTSRGSTHLRGSTAMEGAASTIVTVVKDDGLVTVAADPDEGGKTKDVEPFEKIVLRMVPTADSVVLSEVSAIPVGDVTAAVRSSLVSWWHTHGTEPISVALMTEMEYFSRRNFYRVKKTLLDRGLLAEEGAGSRKRYGLTRDPTA